MLTNEHFLSVFVFTLCAIGALLALVGIGFAAHRMWILSRPIREWLGRSWIARFIRQMGVALGIVTARVRSSMTNLLTFLVIRPWRAFIALLAMLGSMLRKIPWGMGIGVCISVLIFGSLPFVVFTSIGMPLPSIIGVVAAGALIGMICAPFIGWRYRSLGLGKAHRHILSHHRRQHLGFHNAHRCLDNDDCGLKNPPQQTFGRLL